MTVLALSSLDHGRHEETPPVFFLFKRVASDSDAFMDVRNQLPAPNKASLAFILWSSDPENAVNIEEHRQTGRKSSKATDKAAKSATTSRPRRIRLRMCTIDGCTKRAKFHKKCWGHGGSVGCTITDCTNRAKTKGLCWSHGGGKQCSAFKCRTIAVSNGVCWAHGGGKRCRFPGCAKPAYGNIDNLCKVHYQQQQTYPSVIASL